MGEKLPLDWFQQDELRTSGLAQCDAAWMRDKAMYDEFAAVTRAQLARGDDPGIIRTQWTASLLKRNEGAAPSDYAWTMAGLILRLAQSIQMDTELPKI